MMKKSHLVGALSAVAFSFVSMSSQAALVSQLLGLDIGGTRYDVTFHTNTGDTFLALWDADNDGVWGGGASVFTAAPLFWGDSTGALAAANAIAGALGSSDSTVGAFNDNFMVAYGTGTAPPYGTAITTGSDAISVYRDSNGNLTPDNVDTVAYWEYSDLSAQSPYASFQVSEVPVPAAAWLFGSALIGLAGIKRKK